MQIFAVDGIWDVKVLYPVEVADTQWDKGGIRVKGECETGLQEGGDLGSELAVNAQDGEGRVYVVQEVGEGDDEEGQGE